MSRSKEKNQSSLTYGLNGTPKSGVDAYGRVVCNGLLYTHASQMVGLTPDMVEQVILFTSKYTAAVLESDLAMPVMIPGFGKFKIDAKKKFKKEKKMMEYSTIRQINKDGLKRLKNMHESGEAVYAGQKYVRGTKKTPIIIGPYIHTIQGLKLYRIGAMSKEDLHRIFGRDEEIWAQMEVEMKKIDDYKSKKQ